MKNLFFKITAVLVLLCSLQMNSQDYKPIDAVNDLYQEIVSTASDFLLTSNDVQFSDVAVVTIDGHSYTVKVPFANQLVVPTNFSYQLIDVGKISNSDLYDANKSTTLINDITGVVKERLLLHNNLLYNEEPERVQLE